MLDQVQAVSYTEKLGLKSVVSCARDLCLIEDKKPGWKAEAIQNLLLPKNAARMEFLIFNTPFKRPYNRISLFTISLKPIVMKPETQWGYIS